MEKQNKFLLILIIGIMIYFIGVGLIMDGSKVAVQGFIRLQIQPGRLISDSIPLGGIGGTLPVLPMIIQLSELFPLDTYLAITWNKEVQL